MGVPFVVIGIVLILWGIACVVFRVPLARFMKKFNDGYYNGLLQPPEAPPEIVAVFGVFFVGAGVFTLVEGLLNVTA